MPCSTSERISAPITSSRDSWSIFAGVTQGKGFAGAMKRWGFKGLRASPRRFGLAPLARFDRQPPGSGPRLQEQEDGRPHGRRNRTQQNLEVVRTDPIRGLLVHQGLGSGPQGQLADRPGRDQAAAPRCRALSGGILEGLKIEELEVPEAGLVDDAAVHEIPALPSDEEVAAIAAEQEAGGALDSEIEAEAEALPRGSNGSPTEEPKSDGQGSADESKED
jgi:large subunit ribosomal protein L3